MGIEYIPWAEKTDADKADFSDKLAHWRQHGAPGFKTDEAAPFMSHADGKTYTSKSEYRKDLKARGYEEKGDSRNSVQDTTKADDAERIAQIKHSMGEL